MGDDSKLMTNARYKQFVSGIDKALKNFEYSSEWADLISCLGKLNKVIQTYNQYSIIPRKLFIGKRLAQCLHPALPSGVHLKVLESYDIILSQIGTAYLAQDLFIYTSGLFPLLSQASMSVKPQLLDLYEKHFLPLKKLLYPGLCGFLLALLPGIEEASEFSERTSEVLSNLCSSIDAEMFFTCLWDCILHSSQTRLAAMTYLINSTAAVQKNESFKIMGYDVNLMVNALCAAFDDSDVLVQRITLDFVKSYISFHLTPLSQKHLVKLLTCALGVLLRRDMSLNRRIFHWLSNTNSDGSDIFEVNSTKDDTDTAEESYFNLYSKLPLTAAVISLFQDVVYPVDATLKSSTKLPLSYLKPFRVLITLLDKPEVGSLILEEVMLQVFRTIHKHWLLKDDTTLYANYKKFSLVHAELIKNANLLFNSFEPFFMWDYIGRMVKKCNAANKESNDNDENAFYHNLKQLVEMEQPTHTEMFAITEYLLDIVLLESTHELEADHWPNLLKLVIVEMTMSIENLEMLTIRRGISLITKLYSRLSPHIQGMLSNSYTLNFSDLNTIETLSAGKEAFVSYSKNATVKECVTLSKELFVVFVKEKIMKGRKTSEIFAQHGYDIIFKTLNEKNEIDDTMLEDTFEKFCYYLIHLSCLSSTNEPTFSVTTDDKELPHWLHILVVSCCLSECYAIQMTAMKTLMTMVNVTLLITRHASGTFAPLIPANDLNLIENTDVYKNLAKCLWLRITPLNYKQHKELVERFLCLHNITPSSCVCEDVITDAVAHHHVKTKELSFWRLTVLWHLSRDFYKNQKSESVRGTRTVDRCMFLLVDSLKSSNRKIREMCEAWLKHCIDFTDIGRVLETFLFILLDPSSSRIAVHYSHKWPSNQPSTECTSNNSTGDQTDEVDEDGEQTVLTSPRCSKTLQTHPLLIHKLLYTDTYDTEQCQYSLKCILDILQCQGEIFMCAATSTSMSVCDTPRQVILRELLIRHRKVLSAHQLLVRASSAKYIEILLSICLYYIRSDFHMHLKVTNEQKHNNMLVQALSAELLAKISSLLLDIAKNSGKGFSNYISDLMSRCKIQRIALHCLLSTVYSPVGDYSDCVGTGYYSMVDCPNLSSAGVSSLQKSLLNFFDTFIQLEHYIGTENFTQSPCNDLKAKTTKLENCGAFEYIQFKPICLQPMFVSATLTTLKELNWMHVHDNWIQLVISCMHKFDGNISSLVLPVVKQLCLNMDMLTRIIDECEIPPDYMIILLNGLTSIVHFSLLGTSAQSVLFTSVARLPVKPKTAGEDITSSLFASLVHAFSSHQLSGKEDSKDEEEVSSIQDGLLSMLPTILTAVSIVWRCCNENKLPLALGNPHAVHLCILQLLTPIAMNYTAVFLTSVAHVWYHTRETAFAKPPPTVAGKEWLVQINKRYLPAMSAKQRIVLEIVQAIKALTLEKICSTSRQLVKKLASSREHIGASLDMYMFQFFSEILISSTTEEISTIKSSVHLLLKESLQYSLPPPSIFVLFAILDIFVQRVPLPEDRKARKDLQDLAQKYVENLNNVAAASLESSAWFRRNVQVISQDDINEPMQQSTPDAAHTPCGLVKTAQYSVPAMFFLAQYFASMYDLLYLSEEKDKVATTLVYIVSNTIPYLKNHSAKNVSGFRACSALIAAVSDYQYTLRAWKRDVYELFLDAEFFQMDVLSLGFWRVIIDHLISYDSSIFKDLMQKIALSQSGAINIFANREQEMEQRAQLLKRLSFVIFCGEFDQYHQYLPDIQERLAESIRQLQGPFLHEQVFLCFRVLLTRISSNHLVSLWPPVLTELVLVFVHMEHELSCAGKKKSKSKVQALESFLGVNGFFKDPIKWLRLYLAVCKLLDFLFIIPSKTLPSFQVYRWAFSETPGVYYYTPEIQNTVHADLNSKSKLEALNEHKSRIRRDNKDPTKVDNKKDISKMAMLNAPISQQQKHMQKSKKKKGTHDSSSVNEAVVYFLPYISRIARILEAQRKPEDPETHVNLAPGQLKIQQSHIHSIYDLMPFFSSVTGQLAANDVEISKLFKFNMADVELLIEKDFLEAI